MSVSCNTHGSSNNLYQLVYISRITSMAMADSTILTNITTVSNTHNKERNITGILCYGNGNFFQCAEGSEQQLTDLKNTLLLDRRHDDIRILDFSQIAKRRFQKWSMQLIICENRLTNKPQMTEVQPFAPWRWENQEWQDFLNTVHDYYLQNPDASEINVPKTKSLYSLSDFLKKIEKYQAFIFLQGIIALLFILSFISIVMVSKT